MPAKGMAAKHMKDLPAITQPTMTTEHFQRLYSLCKVMARNRGSSTREINEHLHVECGIKMSDTECARLILEVKKRDQAIFGDMAEGGSMRIAVDELESIEKRYKIAEDQIEKLLNDPGARQADIQNWFAALERLTNLKFAVIQNFVIYPQILVATGHVPPQQVVQTVPTTRQISGRGGSAARDGVPAYELPPPPPPPRKKNDGDDDDDDGGSGKKDYGGRR